MDVCVKFETREDIAPKEMATSIVPILGFRAAAKLQAYVQIQILSVSQNLNISSSRMKLTL